MSPRTRAVVALFADWAGPPELEEALAMTMISQPKLDLLVDRIASLSTIPLVAVRILNATNNPNAGIRDLVEVVESDPALMLRCLKVVNSACFGMRRRVTSLTQAIGLLGFTRIRDIALTNSVAGVFRKDCIIGNYRRLGLWAHMVATAICSELVADASRATGCEDSYVAGLLHDIGIIAEDQYAHEAFKDLAASLSDGATLSSQEEAHLGFDHTVLGTRLAEKWHLPEAIRACIRFHHMPQNYRGDFGAVVNVVAVANWIVSKSAFTSVGMCAVSRPDSSFGALGLDHEKTSGVATAFLQRASDGALILFQPDA